MTEQELQEIRERAKKATPGPWEYIEAGNVVVSNRYVYTEISSDFGHVYDAEFIAHARVDIPKLLDEVEKLMVDYQDELLKSDNLTHENERLRKALNQIIGQIYCRDADGLEPDTDEIVDIAAWGLGEEDHCRPPQIRPAVIGFAKEMEKKLKENDHKNHWSECGFDYLIKRLQQETTELIDALKIYSAYTIPPNEVVQEAADVANFAMMIADNLKNNIHGKQRK